MIKSSLHDMLWECQEERISRYFCPELRANPTYAGTLTKIEPKREWKQPIPFYQMRLEFITKKVPKRAKNCFQEGLRTVTYC